MLTHQNQLSKPYHVGEAIQFSPVMGHAIAVVFLDSVVAFEKSFLAHSIPLSAVGRNLVIFIEFSLFIGKQPKFD
jgi:hypothetical protein